MIFGNFVFTFRNALMTVFVNDDTCIIIFLIKKMFIAQFRIHVNTTPITKYVKGITLSSSVHTADTRNTRFHSSFQYKVGC